MTRDSWRVVVYVLLALYMMSLAWIQSFYTESSLIPEFFGDRTDSLLDLWVLCHTLFGAVQYGIWSQVISTVTHTKRLFHNALCLSMISMCIWEGLELAMELGQFGERVAFWKSGIEHWTNRLVGDPFFGVVGCFICHQWPRVFWPALVLSLIWEAVQVSSPTSMSIQEWLFS